MIQFYPGIRIRISYPKPQIAVWISGARAERAESGRTENIGKSQRIVVCMSRRYSTGGGNYEAGTRKSRRAWGSRHSLFPGSSRGREGRSPAYKRVGKDICSPRSWSTGITVILAPSLVRLIESYRAATHVSIWHTLLSPSYGAGSSFHGTVDYI